MRSRNSSSSSRNTGTISSDSCSIRTPVDAAAEIQIGQDEHDLLVDLTQFL